jgi:two-component system, chemotaxis family, CheB/CheR fusion protein
MYTETLATAEGATVLPLETDLQATRDRLQSTTEQLESSNEQLRSGNGELSSVKEELQSANEEWEASREELRSTNEELQTVNSELKTRVDELSCANSDLVNLLECTQIAMFVADRDFALKSFTTAAKDLFHFVETDVGRPVSHIRARLRLDNVQDHAKRVLDTLFPVEQHVESADDAKSYIMRILPYRTVENVIAGVVVTFVDITRITAAEAEVAALTHELRNRVESLERILDLVPVGILIGGVDTMQHVQINRYVARLLGEKTDIRGPRDISIPYRLFDHKRELPFWEQPLQRAVFTGQAVPAVEGRLVRSDGKSLDVLMSAEPLFDERGKPRGAISTIVGIPERKKAEAG